MSAGESSAAATSASARAARRCTRPPIRRSSPSCGATASGCSGVAGTGTWCFVAPEAERADSIRITGSRGTLHLATFSFEPLELTTPAGTERFAFEPPEHIQGPLIGTIVDELRGVGQCPSTGVSAARTSRIMDLILRGEA